MKNFKINLNRPDIFTTFICFISFFYFFFGLSGFISEAGSSVIEFYEKAQVENDKIVLKNIASIKGDDPELNQRLKEIVIGRSPLPGKSRWFDQNYIKIRLKQAGLDLSCLVLKSSDPIEVKRSCVEISEKKIKKIILDFIYKNTFRKQNKVKVDNIRIGSKVILPAGNITYEVKPPLNMDFAGTVVLPVHFMVNGKFQKKIVVTAKVAVFTQVVAAKKALGRNQEITRDDIYLKQVDLGKLSSAVIFNCDEVVGKRAKRIIRAGMALRKDLVEYPDLVKNGDIVVIIAESDEMRISTLGEVKERGFLGERIKVVNLDSKKGIYARILDSKTVKVDF